MLVMDPAVAVNVFVVAPDATETEAGTVTRGLSTDSVTAMPPAGAGCDMVTVHLDVAAELNVVGLQARVLTTVGAVKVKLAVFVTPL